MFKKKKLSNGPFYTGAVVEVDGFTYYIKGKNAVKTSPRAVKSWNFSRIIKATPESLKGYTKHGTLGFRDGTIVRRVSDNKLFLIAGGKRRPVVGPDGFEALGIKWEYEIVHASDAEINIHEEGEDFGI